MARKGTQQLTEGLGLTATPQKDAGKTVATQSLTLTDTRLKGPGKQRADVLSLGDTLTRQVAYKRTLTEQATLSDQPVALQYSGGVLLSQQVGLTAGLQKDLARTLVETAALSGNLSIPVTARESLSLTDILELVRGHLLSKSQTVQLLDGLTIVYTARLAARTEVAHLTDVLDITNMGKVLTEQLGLGAAVLAPDTYTTESSLVFAG